MNNSTSPQVKHILPHTAIAGTAALPLSNVGQGLLDRDTLAQLRALLRCPLAFPQLRQQGFIGMNASVKRCRIVKDRIRLWQEGVRDLVMKLCRALYNFRVHLTPWQPMLESG